VSCSRRVNPFSSNVSLDKGPASPKAVPAKSNSKVINGGAQKRPASPLDPTPASTGTKERDFVSKLTDDSSVLWGSLPGSLASLGKVIFFQKLLQGPSCNLHLSLVAQ
jgi:hypothetical protein